jgi:hypothetical protein
LKDRYKIKPIKSGRFILSIAFISAIILCSHSIGLSQEKEKSLMESYIGNWYGEATIQNVNMSGGWSSGRSLGIHKTTKEIWHINLNVKFLHPLDDPLVVEEYKKLGVPVDHLKSMMSTSLSITGTATINGISEYTHKTREYCQECKGKDGTWKKDFPKILIPVSGNINLTENKINLGFGDLPKIYDVGLSYWFSSENVKMVAPDKIVFSYKRFEDNEIDQILSGELYRIKLQKRHFPEDIKPSEPIKTDNKTQLEITIPSKDVIKVAQSSEAVIRSESLIEVMKGKIYSLIKKLKPKTKFEVKTPVCIAGIRGTEFQIEIEDDGTTTVIVLDGEVEVSDLENKKTVIVRKNQKAVTKHRELPSDPIEIEPHQVFNWWQ